MQSLPLEIQFLVDCQQHIATLAKLQYEEISRHWVPHATIDFAKQRLVEHSNRDKLPLTLVALQNNEPIGMASLRVNDGILPDLRPWLGSLVVSPKNRKSGVGETLITAVKEEALRRGYQTLYLLAFDPTIPHWYARLGWKSIGRDQLFNHEVAVMNIELIPE